MSNGGSVAEPAGTSWVWVGGSPLSLLTESSPAAHPHPTTKTLPHKPDSLTSNGMQELVAPHASCPLINLPMFCYSSVLGKAGKTPLFAVHSVITYTDSHPTPPRPKWPPSSMKSTRSHFQPTFTDSP